MRYHDARCLHRKTLKHGQSAPRVTLVQLVVGKDPRQPVVPRTSLVNIRSWLSMYELYASSEAVVFVGVRPPTDSIASIFI